MNSVKAGVYERGLMCQRSYRPQCRCINDYVTAGTSAYFMKKEDYQFYFKGQSGNDTTRGASFTNNSNHLFSSVNLSAGIEQKVNSKLSITSEPQIKIPVSGIGFGKIK